MVTDTRQKLGLRWGRWGRCVGGGGITETLCGWVVDYPISLYLLQVYLLIICLDFARMEMGWGGVRCEIRGRVRMECVSEKGGGIW